MALPEAETEQKGATARSLAADDGEERSAVDRIAARCWALLLVRIYECLPLLCPRCAR